MRFEGNKYDNANNISSLWSGFCIPEAEKPISLRNCAIVAQQSNQQHFRVLVLLFCLYSLRPRIVQGRNMCLLSFGKACKLTNISSMTYDM